MSDIKIKNKSGIDVTYKNIRSIKLKDENNRNVYYGDFEMEGNFKISLNRQYIGKTGSPMSYEIGTFKSGTTQAITWQNDLDTTGKNTNIYLLPCELTQMATPSGYTSRWSSRLYLIDDSGRLPEGTIVMKPGDSYTSTGGDIVVSKGVLTYTTDHKLTFKHTSDFRVGIHSTSMDFILHINGKNYMVILDYTVWSRSDNNYASTSGRGPAYERITKDYLLSESMVLRNPVTLIKNLVVMYYSLYTENTSYGGYTAEGRLTWNYGEYLPLVCSRDYEDYYL